MIYLVSKYAIKTRKTAKIKWAIVVNILEYSTKPSRGMLFLHSLQRHTCGAHFLIYFLKLPNETASLNDAVRISHIFGPRCKILSLPWYIVLVKGTLTQDVFLNCRDLFLFVYALIKQITENLRCISRFHFIHFCCKCLNILVANRNFSL